MIENITEYLLNHKDIAQYVPFGVIAVMLPAIGYAVYESIKEQKKQAQGILLDRHVRCLTWLETEGIVTIHKDKLKPYDLERLASTTWSKEKGIVRVKKEK